MEEEREVINCYLTVLKPWFLSQLLGAEGDQTISETIKGLKVNNYKHDLWQNIMQLFDLGSWAQLGGKGFVAVCNT